MFRAIFVRQICVPPVAPNPGDATAPSFPFAFFSSILFVYYRVSSPSFFTYPLSDQNLRSHFYGCRCPSLPRGYATDRQSEISASGRGGMAAAAAVRDALIPVNRKETASQASSERAGGGQSVTSWRDRRDYVNITSVLLTSNDH